MQRLRSVVGSEARNSAQHTSSHACAMPMSAWAIKYSGSVEAANSVMALPVTNAAPLNASSPRCARNRTPRLTATAAASSTATDSARASHMLSVG